MEGGSGELQGSQPDRGPKRRLWRRSTWVHSQGTERTTRGLAPEAGFWKGRFCLYQLIFYHAQVTHRVDESTWISAKPLTSSPMAFLWKSWQHIFSTGALLINLWFAWVIAHGNKILNAISLHQHAFEVLKEFIPISRNILQTVF